MAREQLRPKDEAKGRGPEGEKGRDKLRKLEIDKVEMKLENIVWGLGASFGFRLS